MGYLQVNEHLLPGNPEGEERGKETENLLKEIIAENSQSLGDI